MRSVRPVVRTLIAVLLAGFCPMLVAASVQASALETQQRSSGTVPADSHSLTISIDKVSPQYARSTSTVTVSGTLSNHTGSAIPDIVLQVQTSYQAFGNRSQMTAFSANGEYPYELSQAAPSQPATASLANGATMRWTLSYSAAAFYSGFGVYPIVVQATSMAATTYQATAQTFLPFWPGHQGTSTLKRLQVAWVWPLIDAPQQGACAQTLATPALARSLAPGGRLSTLLDTGAQGAARDDLTWAIDPALLSDATVMTHAPYFSGGDAGCTGRTRYATPSAAATKWLATLRTDTAGKPAFATPYADVDASALVRNGLDANLRSAYQLGEAEADKILPGTFGKNGNSSGATAALAAAWPADGSADAGVLDSLATAGGVNTVVLSSDELPTSAPLFDNALARTRTDSGTSVSVLLADSAITSILGSVSARRTAAAQFAVEQDFLAQTAMILAEAPNASRSLVVAPPAGWDPSAAEAADLLRLTKDAPWLRATGLGLLAEQASKVSKVSAQKLRPQRVSKTGLSDEYVDHIESLTASVDQYESLLSQTPATGSPVFDAAVAVTESAAWRGTGSTGGWLALTKLSSFVHRQEVQVQLIASKKVLLAGTSGTTPVSVSNGLSVPVQVEVRVIIPPGSALQVRSFKRLLTVNPHMTQTAYIPVRSSSIGTTTMQIQLFTRNGSPLTTPQASVSMSVEVTRFGRTLLVIIGGALGVLVLTAIWRLRRKRRADGTRAGGSDDRADDNAASGAHVGGAG
jgi:Family of unknown function (DUF6049)